jgi:flavin-binding protein dodecin
MNCALATGEPGNTGARTMTMLKVIEVLAQSEKSWEDAAQSAISTASETVRDVRSIYVENLEATVEDGKIQQYRINAKITFLVESS